MVLTSVISLAEDTFQQLIKPDNDDDLNLDHKIEKIGRHEIYGELQRNRKDNKDMIVLFYHPQCPHCHLFIPKLTKIVNIMKKENTAIEFFLGDCGINPHYLAAFQVTYFPFMVYFHAGLPFESMPAVFTLSEVLTTKWIKDTHKKFANYKVGSNILGGTKIKNVNALFKKYLSILRKQLFKKDVMHLSDPTNPSAGLLGNTITKKPLDSASSSTLKDLKKDKSFKLAKKSKKSKNAISDALKLADSLELDDDIDE